MPDSASDRNTEPPTRSVRVQCGSRLHFGLLDVAAPFGGVGVMINDPLNDVTVTRAESFDAGDTQAQRITDIGTRVAQFQTSDTLPACRVRVNRLAPQHSGLGSGTQLSLAVAEAMARVTGLRVSTDQLITELADRRKRSAVGSYGYFQGGLIYESGSESGDSSQLLYRIEIPTEWSIVVLRPVASGPAVSGQVEAKQFDKLSRPDSATVERLKSQIRDEILPAAAEKSFADFATAVTRYNAASGELFSAVQGGVYNGPDVAAVIDWLAGHGVCGYGQSSWGPGVFAWCESHDDAKRLVKQLPESIACLTITTARNLGRELSEES